MKQIIIFLLVVILAVLGYNQYQKYKRFSLSGYEYVIPDKIDIHYWDQDVLFRYYESVERLNGFVITQWSAHGIDVRNPKKDNSKTRAAVQNYSDLKAKVTYYENALAESARLKDEGWGNKEIKLLYEGKFEINKREDSKKRKYTTLQLMFDELNTPEIRSGTRGALVYEIQQILISKGYNIPSDGIYRIETTNAILDFEEKNELFPDGVLDRLTFEALLR